MIGRTVSPGHFHAAWPDLGPVRLGDAVAVCSVATASPPPGGWMALLDQLDAGERARAGRFHRERDRDSYIAVHVLVRTLLSACHGPAGPAPAAWRFAAGRHGKPYALDCDLSFNLSHAPGLGACTLALGRDVGIDVESLDQPADAILTECLTPAESGSLAALLPDARLDRFLRLWTLKEALSKATGEGLGLRFEDVGFEDVGFGSAPPRLVTSPAHLHPLDGWQFMQWRPGPQHVGALALRRRTGPDLPILVWSADPHTPWPL